MQRIIGISVAVLLFISVASVSFAGEKYAAPPPYKPPVKKDVSEKEHHEHHEHHKHHHITGVIKEIDTAGKTITVKEMENVVVISVDEKMLSKLKIDEKVKVEYISENGKKIAEMIRNIEKEKHHKGEK